jgi:DNA (cytosine-5)-methyltransferase 1
MPYRTLAKDGGIDAGYAPRPVIDALHGPTGNKEPLLRSAASVRRLTPVECERLMSWPDSWTAPNGIKAPDSRRYAACGDGVVANVAEWIGIGIKAAA